MRSDFSLKTFLHLYKFFPPKRALQNLRRQDLRVETLKIFVQDFVPIRTALKV